ncbi:MAG: class I SAM-dependent methyltransferase [Acidobacteriota bacterium]|nr:class I SAM-dependent methyltransferase [Acidobacteriota bacterium]
MDDWLFNYAVERLQATRASGSAACKVCGGQADLFDIVDFNKSCHRTQYPLGLSGVPVSYRMCHECRFVFTDFFEGFTADEWKRYVYNKDYETVDPDYLSVRPALNARDIGTLLHGRKSSVIGLDYGGGNGMTMSLLRQDGWAFDTYDPFGQTDMSQERVGRYNFCSAVEVFEHLPDPIGSMREIVEKASPDRLIILIGTQTLDGNVSDETRLSWWYAAPRNGHVSLYSKKSLQTAGALFGLEYSCFRGYPHLLTRGLTLREAQALLVKFKLLRLRRRLFR